MNLKRGIFPLEIHTKDVQAQPFCPQLYYRGKARIVLTDTRIIHFLAHLLFFSNLINIAYPQGISAVLHNNILSSVLTGRDKILIM